MVEVDRKMLGARVAQKRVEAGMSAAELAARVGMKQQGIASIEAGDVSRPRKLLELARELSTTQEWLLYGDDLPAARQVAGFTTIPVMGRVGAGAEIEPEFEQVGPDGLFEVEVAIPLPPDMIGFEVVGDSMYPRFDDGDVVICARDGEPQAIAHGDEAAVRTSDGRRFLKKVMRDGNHFTLISHNAPPILGVGLEWASPVVLTVHQSRWRKLGNGNGNGRSTPPRKNRKT